jgi:RNA recognition motif-containing protein
LFVIFSSYGLVLNFIYFILCVCFFASYVGFFRDGKSRHFAFIGFHIKHEAEEAIKYFNKVTNIYKVDGCIHKVDPVI